MKVIIKSIERTTWQQLALNFSDYRYQQLWDFGIACAARLNADSDHIAVYKDNELIGLADVRIKKIPFVPAGVAYINAGPMVRKDNDRQKNTERLQIVLECLIDTYVKQKKFILRIQPVIGSGDWNDLLETQLMASGYIINKQIQPYRTFIVDISQSIEIIRKQLNQKWRNCLNNSEKRGLLVKTGTDDDLFSIFISLYNELIKRKKFDVDLEPEFYFQAQKNLAAHEKFLVTVIYDEDQPVAGHVATILGDTCVYLLGATSDKGLKNNSAYIAQWSVIQAAKERGCLWYDLGGIDPEENPGVYHFKKGLGGQDIESPGTFEYYPDIFRRFLVRNSEKAYKVMRHFIPR